MRANLVLSLYRAGLEHPAWTEERAEKHHESLVFFIEHFVRPKLPVPDFHKNRVFFREVKGEILEHPGWYWLMVRYDAYMNLAPRDHAKSHCHSIYYPLWRICCDRNWRHITLSDTVGQAQKFLGGARTHLERNPYIIAGFGHQDAFFDEYKGFVPPLGKGWGSEAFTVNRRIVGAGGHIEIEKDPTILALGMGSPCDGPHCDSAGYDDICSDDNSTTAFQADKTTHWMEHSFSMIDPGGQTIIVGTPKTFRDTYTHIKKNPAFAVFECPSPLDEDEQVVLWPGMWPYSALMQKKAKQGSIQFNRNYLLMVMSEEDSYFPMAWLKLCFDPTLILPIEHHDPKMIKATGVDPAIAEGKTASYFSTVSLGLERDGRLVLLDIFRRKAMSPVTQRRKIKELWERYDSEMVVETNGVQKYLTDELPLEIPVKLFWTGAKKMDFDVGIPALSAMVEQGRLRIPRGDQRSETLTDLLINEAHYWPRYGSTDVLMAFWFAASRLRTLAKRYNINFVLPSIGTGLMGRRDVDFGLAMSNNERLPGLDLGSIRPVLAGIGGGHIRSRKESLRRKRLGI